MREKIEELLKQESLINEYGVRLHFIGDMQLLTEPVRVALEKAMNYLKSTMVLTLYVKNQLHFLFPILRIKPMIIILFVWNCDMS